MHLFTEQRLFSIPRLLKWISLISLVILVRPIPPLVAFSNPADGVVFGRYTQVYFVLMAGYILASLAWLALTIWILTRADNERIATWRLWLLRYRKAIFLLLSLLVTGMGLMNGLIADIIIVSPSAVQTGIRFVPVGMLVGLWLMIGLVLHQPGERTALLKVALFAGTLLVLRRLPLMFTEPISPGAVLGQFSPYYTGVLSVWLIVGAAGAVGTAWLLLWLDEARKDAWHGWLDNHRANRIRVDSPVVVLIVASLLLITLAIRAGLFTTYLIRDTTLHLYIGQAVLRGDVPYLDVVYLHPPLRFVASAAGIGLASLLNLPVVELIRVVNLLLAVGLLYGLYRIGLNFTGQPIGGLFAMSIFLLLPLLVTMVVRNGPTLKLFFFVLLTTNLIAVQEKRWGWAGVLSAGMVLMWLPSGVALPVILLAILLSKGPARWLAAGRYVAAGLATGGVVLVPFILTGAVDEMLGQTIGTALSAATTSIGPQPGFFPPALWQRHLSWSGGVPMLVLYSFGLGGLIYKERMQIFSKPGISGLVVGLLPLLVIISTDHIGDGDFLIATILMASLGSFGLWSLLPNLWGQNTRIPKLALGGFLLVIMLLSSLTPVADHSDITLQDLKELTAIIDHNLESDDTIQSLDQLWYPVLSGKENLLPIMHIGEKGGAAARIAGWPEDVIVEELLAQEPVLILMPVDYVELFDPALSGRYVTAGTWRVGDQDQVFYVHPTRPDLVRALQEWWEVRDSH